MPGSYQSEAASAEQVLVVGSAGMARVGLLAEMPGRLEIVAFAVKT